jgi:hypothetical protein
MAAEELTALRDALEDALRRANRLLQGGQAPADPAFAGLPRTQAIEAVLRESGQPMRPVEIWARLRAVGRDDPKMEVQVTTFDLWKRGRIAKVSRGQYQSKPDEDKAMTGYQDDIASVERMMEDVRRIRDRTCEPKSNVNPRYHALSAAVSQLSKAIQDMRGEA